MSYALNAGRRMGWIESFPNLKGYMERMFARPHCTLDPS